MKEAQRMEQNIFTERDRQETFDCILPITREMLAAYYQWLRD